MVGNTLFAAAMLGAVAITSISAASANTITKQKVISFDDFGNRVVKIRIVETDDAGNTIVKMRMIKTDPFGDKIVKTRIVRPDGGQNDGAPPVNTDDAGAQGGPGPANTAQ